MRIISGKYRGQIIKMPRGIRPTQNKVRKAIFDILGDLEGMSFLELFAGSGAVGFEALSKGAGDLVLVEYNHDCQLAIEKNIESLKVRSCVLYPYQIDKALDILNKKGRKFDIIFLDPPYSLGITKKTLIKISDYDILNPSGFIMVQHAIKDMLPDTLGVFSLVKRWFYGDTILSLYTHNFSTHSA